MEPSKNPKVAHMIWLSNAFEFTHDYQTKRSLLDKRRDDIEGSGPIWAGQINKELTNANGNRTACP